MDQTLQALGGILLKGIPTVILLLILHFYLKAVLFRPLTKVLKQREELTEGARKAAQQSLANAELKAQEYEGKLREARSEVYRQQEETRKGWLDDQTAQTAAAHERTSLSVRTAKEQITAEAAAARQTLVDTTGPLADQIATAVLAPKDGMNVESPL